MDKGAKSSHAALCKSLARRLTKSMRGVIINLRLFVESRKNQGSVSDHLGLDMQVFRDYDDAFLTRILTAERIFQCIYVWWCKHNDKTLSVARRFFRRTRRSLYHTGEPLLTCLITSHPLPRAHLVLNVSVNTEVISNSPKNTEGAIRVLFSVGI